MTVENLWKLMAPSLWKAAPTDTVKFVVRHHTEEGRLIEIPVELRWVEFLKGGSGQDRTEITVELTPCG